MSSFDPDVVIRQSRANTSHHPVTTAHYLLDIVMNEEEPDLTDQQHCQRLAEEFQRALDAGFFESIRYDTLIFSVPQRVVLDVAPPNEPLKVKEEAASGKDQEEHALKAELFKLLDSCFCDSHDNDGVDCPRCVRVRAAWNALK